MNVDYTDDLAFLVNTSTENESPLLISEQAAKEISFSVNTNKTEFVCFKQNCANSTLNGKPLKLVDHFTCLGSSISLTESDVNTNIGKVWTVINYKEILSLWQNKAEILHITSISWLHLKNFNQVLREKARWELHKNVAYCFAQVLEAALNKTAAVQPLASHLTRHPS